MNAGGAARANFVPRVLLTQSTDSIDTRDKFLSFHSRRKMAFFSTLKIYFVLNFHFLFSILPEYFSVTFFFLRREDDRIKYKVFVIKVVIKLLYK